MEEEQRRAKQQNESTKAGSLSPTHKSLKNIKLADNCSIRFTCDLLDGVILPKNKVLNFFNEVFFKIFLDI